MCVNVCLEVWSTWREGDSWCEREGKTEIETMEDKNRTKNEEKRSWQKRYGNKNGPCMMLTVRKRSVLVRVRVCPDRQSKTVQRKANRIILQPYIMWQSLSSFNPAQTTHKSFDAWDAADGWMLSAKCFPISHWEINKWMGDVVSELFCTHCRENTFCLCGLTWSQPASWISAPN